MQGTFYGDASGGIFSSMPRIRRIGCGIVQIDATGELIWGQHFNLPGNIQTVPRGELYVLLYMVERLEPFANVTYVTDNQKVSETYQKGKEAALKSTNCDLFREIFRLIEINFLKVHVRWMPSHLKDEDEHPEGVSLLDVKGNRLADVQAGKAAHDHAVPVNISSTHIYYFSLTRKIQKRLVDIITSLPHRTKLPKPPRPFSPPELDPSIDDLMELTQHVPFLHDGRISCARCMNSLPSSGITTKHWLKTPCNAIASGKDKPVRLHHSTIQIGHLSTHPTHSLTVYRGILFCNRCGSRGIVKLRNLARQCEAPGAAGTALLRAINNNKLPNGVDEWPNPSLIHAGTANAGDPEVEEVIRGLVPSLRRIEAESDPFASAAIDENGVTTEEESETACVFPPTPKRLGSPTVDSGSD